MEIKSGADFQDIFLQKNIHLRKNPNYLVFKCRRQLKYHFIICKSDEQIAEGFQYEPAFINGTLKNDSLPYNFKVLSTSMAFLDSLPEEYSGLDANVIAKKLWARRGENGDGVRFIPIDVNQAFFLVERRS